MKKSNFSIIYFLLLFIILDYSFYLYVGVTTPGGKVYSPFLYRYLNIPYWLSIIVTKAAEMLLQLAGFATYQKSPVNITIKGGRGVNIAWPCLGIGVMAFWLAFVAAHKEKVNYKLKWIICGIILISIVNILRVATIAISLHYKWKNIEALDAHKTFNIITYIIIFLLMLVFVYFYNRRVKSIATTFDQK